jgi:hypothetical protein
MYNPYKKSFYKKPLFWIFFALIITVGVVFGIIKFVSFFEDFQISGTRAIGKVSRVYQEACGDYEEGRVCTKGDITFTAENGRSFTFNSNYNYSSMKVGDTVTVYYDPKNPNNASVSIKGFSIMIITIVLLGLLSSAVPFIIIILLFIWYRNNNVNTIKKNWIPVKARITKTYSDNFGNKKIEAVYKNNTFYGFIYDKNNVWRDDDEVNVYINPNNPAKYFVDTLPPSMDTSQQIKYEKF